MWDSPRICCFWHKWIGYTMQRLLECVDFVSLESSAERRCMRADATKLVSYTSAHAPCQLLSQGRPKPRTPGHAVMPAEHIWLTDFLCGWPIGVKFIARCSKRPGCWRRHLHTLTENVFICDVLIWCIQRTTMCCISTLLLTYLG